MLYQVEFQSLLSGGIKRVGLSPSVVKVLKVKYSVLRTYATPVCDTSTTPTGETFHPPSTRINIGVNCAHA